MKEYKDIYCINGMAVFVALVIYYFAEKPELPLGIIATGISISFGMRQYKIENDKMFKDLFSTFNQKYDEKFNKSLNKIDAKTQKDSAYSLSEKKEELIVDYLNFCAEEYLWYKKERIENSVWKSWKAGMTYYLKISSINVIVEKEKAQKDSYYGLFDELKL